uniref:PLAC8 family protein n=1 Tax=Davidia involucrata TaxID=16924 RepID=A0A5B7AR90_DAVIN
MAEPEKRETVGHGGAGEEEEEKFLEGVAVLDFDMLCSTVAMQTQGKWRKLDNHEYEDGGEFGGVLRMWEGELLDCFEDRRVALESTCCPCYRFGKNMGRAGFGSCFIQDSDSSLDDCVYHMICPCCSLCQESRTLEMNNVQDGTWHGRGDTICVGGYGESSKAFFELCPPPIMSTKSPEPCSIQKSPNAGDHSWVIEVGHSAPLVPLPPFQ